jgi:hypothetical protein
MRVMVSITLDPGDTLNLTADEIAERVLTGLDGDPDKDSVMSNVQKAPEIGGAGTAIPVAPPDPPA